MTDAERIEQIVTSGRWAPRHGWHDDHRHRDGTPEYLPAVQQVRAEFLALLEALDKRAVTDGRALQLGFGECAASHEILDAMFARGAVTLDRRECVIEDSVDPLPGRELRDPETVAFAKSHGPYSFLYCDAEHSHLGVWQDYREYAPLVSFGGVIAFHDTLERNGYPEVQVWKFLQDLENAGVKVNRIGTEVGCAWIVKQ